MAHKPNKIILLTVTNTSSFKSLVFAVLFCFVEIPLVGNPQLFLTGLTTLYDLYYSDGCNGTDSVKYNVFLTLASDTLG